MTTADIKSKSKKTTVEVLVPALSARYSPYDPLRCFERTSRKTVDLVDLDVERAERFCALQARLWREAVEANYNSFLKDHLYMNASDICLWWTQQRHKYPEYLELQSAYGQAVCKAVVEKFVQRSQGKAHGHVSRIREPHYAFTTTKARLIYGTKQFSRNGVTWTAHVIEAIHLPGFGRVEFDHASRKWMSWLRTRAACKIRLNRVHVWRDKSQRWRCTLTFTRLDAEERKQQRRAIGRSVKLPAYEERLNSKILAAFRAAQQDFYDGFVPTGALLDYLHQHGYPKLRGCDVVKATGQQATRQWIGCRRVSGHRWENMRRPLPALSHEVVVVRRVPDPAKVLDPNDFNIHVAPLQSRRRPKQREILDPFADR